MIFPIDTGGVGDLSHEVICNSQCAYHVYILQEAQRVRKLKEKAGLQKLKEEENCCEQLWQDAGLNSFKLMHMHKAQEEFNRKQE